MKRTQPHNYFQKEENPMKVTEMKHIREEKKKKKKPREHQVVCYNGQCLYYRYFAQKVFMFSVLKN